ncbi:hypothetical protein C6497_14990 [Candidatus Poribacteria bacterium]|nr:MAG: hypothetical protein C6497_14990 [Candidatus Poribacteria bacterium]
MTGLTIFAMFFGFFTAIYWMVVGWRAMLAHEKVADSLEWIARESAKSNNTNVNSGQETSENTE